jgi:hypothetical protein
MNKIEKKSRPKFFPALTFRYPLVGRFFNSAQTIENSGAGDRDRTGDIQLGSLPLREIGRQLAHGLLLPCCW